jgi:hypothetical protein
VQLLISVADAREAYSAVAGGAVIVDAKEPAEGPLGAVLPHVLRDIVAAVRGACPISVALGDAPAEDDPDAGGDPEGAVFGRARDASRAGADYVKLGFARTPTAERAAELTAAAVRGANAGSAGVRVRATRVVAVGYADADRVGGVSPDEIIGVAMRGGAAGVLLDTADKQGGGLFDLMSVERLLDWVREAERAGLIPALAGKLDDRGVATARLLGAHVAGVRGAACRGGRDGPLLTARVRELADAAAGLGALPIDSWFAVRR